MIKKQQSKAFTLVELIVVITILAILGTISFISLQGYSKSARDSVRISDLNNIEKGLELQLTKGRKVSIPDDKVDITASGTVISYQGYAGEQVLQNIGVHGGGKDPSEDNYYTYTTSANLLKYQIMGFLENGDEISLLNNTFSADYSSKTPIVKGHKLGILLLSGSLIPIQETGIGVDIINTTDEFKAYLDNENNGAISGTGKALGIINNLINSNKSITYDIANAVKDEELILYFNMESLDLDGKLIDLSGNGNNGTIFGGAVGGDSLGVKGKSMLFDGVNDHIAIPISYGVSELPETTICTWVKSGSSSYQMIASFDRSEVWRLALKDDSAGKNIGWDTTDDANLVDDMWSDDDYSDNEWHFICGWYKKGESPNKIIYVDGVNVKSTTAHLNRSLGAGQERPKTYGFIGVGSEASTFNGNVGPDLRFNGLIDEFRIYNRALSETEIQTLYNQREPN